MKSHYCLVCSIPMKAVATKIVTLTRILFSTIIAILTPIILYHSTSPWLAYSYNSQNALFEFFGFSTSLVIVTNITIEIITNRPINKQTSTIWVKIGAFVVLFSYLVLISEYSRVEYDYSAYENAARGLLSGISPYQTTPPYIYPPLLAQLIEFAFKSVRWISVNVFHMELGIDEIFFHVFYLYQCLQLIFIVVSYILCCRFGQKIGLEEKNSVLLCTILFLVNAPLIRNLRLGQVNLQLLLSVLGVLLWTDTLPFLSGFLVAYGTLLKIYPLIFSLPWVIHKKYKPIFSAILIGGIIILIQTMALGGFNLYFQFFDYLEDPEKGIALRNNSLISLSFNISKFIASFLSTVNRELLTTIIFTTLTFTSISFIGVRFYQRRKLGLRQDSLFIADSIDTIALMLLLSPSVWDHHFVTTIPMAIYALGNHKNKIILASLGALLIYFIPTFDVFFFSYYRLAGLILLLLAIQPVNIESNHSFIQPNPRPT